MSLQSVFGKPFIKSDPARLLQFDLPRGRVFTSIQREGQAAELEELTESVFNRQEG